MDGTLRSILHIGNDLRVMSGGMVFPRQLAGGHSSLPDALRAQLRSGAGIGRWVVSGALYGSDAQVAAARAAVRAALKHTAARPTFLNEGKLRMARCWAACWAILRVDSASRPRWRWENPYSR